MMQKTLVGKVALVTGASRGIGRGIALALASAGAKVYATGRRSDKSLSNNDSNLPTLEQTVQEISQRSGISVPPMYCDGDSNAGAAVVETIAKTDGRLDVLVNNAFAGISVHQRLHHRKFFVIAVILLIWIVTLIVVLALICPPPADRTAIGEMFFQIYSKQFYVIPLLMTVMYLRIAFTVRRERRRSSIVATAQTNACIGGLRNIEMKLLAQGAVICILLIARTVIFLVVPQIRFGDAVSQEILNVFANAIWIADSMVNPCIFFTVNRDVRQQSVRLLDSWLFWRRSRSASSGGGMRPLHKPLSPISPVMIK